MSCCCYQPLSGTLPLTSEDFVVLGSGIMDDAEFDLPAAVLRRVRVCASVQTYTRTYVHLHSYVHVSSCYTQVVHECVTVCIRMYVCKCVTIGQLLVCMHNIAVTLSLCSSS